MSKAAVKYLWHFWYPVLKTERSVTLTLQSALISVKCDGKPIRAVLKAGNCQRLGGKKKEKKRKKKLKQTKGSNGTLFWGWVGYNGDNTLSD